MISKKCGLVMSDITIAMVCVRRDVSARACGFGS
jgi:hypothetical protein